MVDLEHAKKLLEDVVKRAPNIEGRGDLSNFFILCENGHYEEWLGQVCYNPICHFNMLRDLTPNDRQYSPEICRVSDNLPIKYFADYGLYRKHKTGSHETYDSGFWKACITDNDLKYIDYVINKSPYADAHLLKDAEYVSKNGVIIDANYPTNYVYGAAILIRMLSDYPYVSERFEEFRKHVNNQNIALFFSPFLKIEDEFLSNYSYAYHHALLQKGRLYKQALVNMMNDNKESFKRYSNFAVDVRINGLYKPWLDDESDADASLMFEFPRHEIDTRERNAFGDIVTVSKSPVDKLPEYFSKIERALS